MKQTDEQYEEIARRDWERKIYAECDAEDKQKEEKCEYCEQIKNNGGFGPSHNGTRLCRSGSIASGGNRAHCTCDLCF
jgi:hypothetical protein